MMHPSPWFRRIVRMRPLRGLVGLLLAVSAAACGGEAEPRVFFVQPEDGATLTSPVDARFGAENIEVRAVPEKVETPREGVIHYHLGVDADCLPPGTRIPDADPWIHFGDGSNQIEMQLETGEHRLTVQAGDDRHRTIEGLCQTITITVRKKG